MAYESTRSFILGQLANQITIIILAIINTYYPEYLSYTFIAFIAFFFVITTLRARPKLMGVSLEQLKEIRESEKIHEEDSSGVARTMSQDPQLAQELAPLTRMMFISIFAIVLSLIWYYLYFNSVRGLTQETAPSETQRFMLFLVGYEVPFALVAIMNFNQNKLLRNTPQIPGRYTLFEKGLVGQGIVMKFPLQGHEARLDAKRGFVELVNGKGRRIRLYSSKPKDLFELIKKHGFGEN
jgi:uncharacterized membrane protein